MIRILLSLFILLTLSVPNAYPYNDTTTHRRISERAFFHSNTRKNNYFEHALLMEDGINSYINELTLLKWVELGAQLEDDPMCRASNHFHNPYLDWTVSGLSDTWFLTDWWCWATSPYKPSEIKSNVIWATGYSDRGYLDPYFYVSEINDWDWKSARLFYLAYLTGRDGENDWLTVENEQRRDQFLSYTFKSLGQLMHLLQDTAVPAHVRDDFSQGHTRYLPDHESTWNIFKWYGNLFEDYVRFNNRSSWFENIIEGDFADDDFRITDLWDTNFLRRWTTPEQISQIDMSSLGLAEYTSMNFLSMFSMFEKDGSDGSLVFPYPNPEHCVVQAQEIMVDNKSVERLFLTSWNNHPGETVNKLAAVGFLKYYRDVYFPDVSNEKQTIVLDGNCYEEYAQKLIPRAIGYSADLLDYFFRGQLAVTVTPRFRNNALEDIGLNIQNATESQEVMSEGNFFLLFRYTPVGGESDGSGDVFVRADQTPASGTLDYEDIVVHAFTPSKPIPIECWNTVTCTLAFQGTLGNEINAVVGKVFKPGKVLFSEDWENGIIYADDKWQDTGDSDDYSSKEVNADGHLIMKSSRPPQQKGSSRVNALFADFTTDGSNGILITPTTELHFLIPEMITTVEDAEDLTSNALRLLFNEGPIIQYSGEGVPVSGSEMGHISVGFKLSDKHLVDNIVDRFSSANITLPDPLYLRGIQLQQKAYIIDFNDYSFYIDVDAIRIFDTQREE